MWLGRPPEESTTEHAPLALLPERGYHDRNGLATKAPYRLGPPPGTRMGGWFRCSSTWKQPDRRNSHSAPPSPASPLLGLLFQHQLRRWDAAFGEPCLVFQGWRAECCPGFSSRRNKRPTDLTPFPCLKMKEKAVLVYSQTGFDRILKIKKCETREIWICGKVLCERILWVPCQWSTLQQDCLRFSGCQVRGLTITRMCCWGASLEGDVR